MTPPFNPNCVCGGSTAAPNPDCERCQMHAEIEKLRAALEQYADRSMWNCADRCPACEQLEYKEQVTRPHERDWWQGDCAGYYIAEKALGEHE